MKCIVLRISTLFSLFLGVWISFLPHKLIAQGRQEMLPTQATVNLPLEIRFLSQKIYTQPLVDIRLRATFRHVATGRSITLSGYWDGNVMAGTRDYAAFNVRFLADTDGVWEWTTVCSDTSNNTLHRRSGYFIAQKNQSANPLLERGAVRLASNRRTLEYGDGTPFFWLGDTAWNIPESSTRDEVIRFLDDRAQKGFTVVQLTFASAAFFTDFGNRNRAGETLYLPNNYSQHSLYNPRWFDYVDSVAAWANARGIVLGIMPQFASGLIEGYDRGWVTSTKLLTREEVRIGIRYLAARYAAHHVVWITGGDVQYNTPDIRAFWAEYGRELKETSGGRQLISIHPEGLTASYDFFDNATSTSWLDFHILQSSHQPWSDGRTEMLRRGYVQTPPKPILNAEPPYEGIELNFFLSDLQAAFVGGKYPATDYDVRLAAYMSIFHGGLVGITYGANGLFQWNSASKPDRSFNPRLNTDEALNLPGSAQYGILKRILTGLAWHEMTPRMDLLSSAAYEQGTAGFTGVLSSNVALCLYSSKGLRTCAVLCGALRGEGGLSAKWISPTSGTVQEAYILPFSAQPLTFRAPDSKQDWVLAVQRERSFIARNNVDSTDIKLLRFLANQTNSFVELGFSVPEAGTLEIDVADARGASLLRQTVQASRGEAYFVLPISARGAYFYSVRFYNERIQRRLTGKFLQQ